MRGKIDVFKALLTVLCLSFRVFLGIIVFFFALLTPSSLRFSRPSEILKDVRDSYTTMLDRWDLTIETDSGTKKVKTFNNYFGIGADAQAALDFHRLRENKPELFFSRMTNKVWYAVLGAEDIFKNSCIDIPRRMTLICDGVEVAIPDDCQGLVFLNIDSYAGGINLWSGGQYPEQIEEEEER